jgi:hypothetical protein
VGVTDRASLAVGDFALPPVRLEERSMLKADEYRQLADDCIVWASIAISDDQHELFLEVAKEWRKYAESIDQCSVAGVHRRAYRRAYRHGYHY